MQVPRDLAYTHLISSLEIQANVSEQWALDPYCPLLNYIKLRPEESSVPQSFGNEPQPNLKQIAES